MQLLIYTPNVTPRIKYIFNFIFREILDGDFEFTSIAEVFKESKLAKLSYADQPLGDELFFRALPLLYKNNIEKTEIKKTIFGDKEVPFAVENSTLPFDVFAASFYFLSRYEEYLPFNPDEHLRYKAEDSLQFQLGLLDAPIIDNWAIILKNIIRKHFPYLSFNKRKFQLIPTIDIDRAYHFRSSGVVKNSARIIKAIFELDRERIKNIISTGLKTNKDPFDVYEYLHQLYQKHRLNAIFFFLLADSGHKKFDVNVHPTDGLVKELIVETVKYAQIGIHPSYASNENTNKIKEELLTLELISDQKIDISRQHFLRLNFPKTYLQLIKAGINHDYSMGYPSQVGFRAGTCTPFFWYDLQLEKQSHLVVHPFAVMDVTLRKYLNLSPSEAIAKLDELLSNVKMVEGTFVSLWHNESLSEEGKWKGWREVYEHLLNHN